VYREACTRCTLLINSNERIDALEIRKRTIFDTPLLKTFLRGLCMIALKAAGWKVARNVPNTRKYILIAAPHTSNWDFVLVMLIAFAMDIKVYTMMKKEVLDWKFGSVFKWLGVIPVDRTKSVNTVEQVVEAFKENDDLVIVVSPPGTRKKVRKWKTGFYHMASGANIPIALGFLDYGRKTGGIGGAIHPSGDIKSDMMKIKAFYADITGKHPDHASEYIPLEVTS
jgi:1-acyl-sn-glycerol-3-phosphate acyltransferase